MHRDRDAEGRLCADTVAELLEQPPWGFDIVFTGPGGSHRLSRDLLATAELYVQPGGGTLDRAYRRVRRSRSVIRSHIASGGRYLGICLGGYLAGATPGFDLLPGDADRYIDLADADVRHDGEAVIPVTWRDGQRRLYFQDGPYFVVDEDRVDVVARYRNGEIAALVAPFGSGRVAVCGPHPEAGPDWFQDLPDPSVVAPSTDLVADLIDSLYRRAPAGRG